jgi:hypothetical protein
MNQPADEPCQGLLCSSITVLASCPLLCFHVTLRLNRMGDEGCKVVCESLRANTSLQKLSLGANSAGKVGITLHTLQFELLQSLQMRLRPKRRVGWAPPASTALMDVKSWMDVKS